MENRIEYNKGYTEGFNAGKEQSISHGNWEALMQLLGQCEKEKNSAIYQIKRTVAQLKEASHHHPEIEVKFRSMTALAIEKQLEAFLAEITDEQQESTDKPT